MQLSVIVDDNLIICDGVVLSCDLSQIAIDLSNIHSIHWFGQNGQIEHENGAMNSTFSSAEFIQPFIDLHTDALAEISAPPPLDEYKLLKIADAERYAGEQILAGFESDALGTTHSYGGKKTDQLNLIGAASSGVDLPFPCADADGNWERRVHTPAQFQEVVADGSAHKQGILTALDVIRTTIQNAPSYAAVDAAMEL